MKIVFDIFEIIANTSELAKELVNKKLFIFEIIDNTSELAKELVNKKWLIFKRFQVNAKEIKCAF